MSHRHDIVVVYCHHRLSLCGIRGGRIDNALQPPASNGPIARCFVIHKSVFPANASREPCKSVRRARMRAYAVCAKHYPGAESALANSVRSAAIPLFIFVQTVTAPAAGRHRRRHVDGGFHAAEPAPCRRIRRSWRTGRKRASIATRASRQAAEMAATPPQRQSPVRATGCCECRDGIAIASSSRSSVTGLTRCMSNPAASARCRSSGWP